MQTGSHITRLKFATVVLAGIWFVLWGHVVRIQAFHHKQYHDRAFDQYVDSAVIHARRGRILDRNGVEMAVNVTSASYGIRPEEITDVSEAVRLLGGATGMSDSDVRDVVTSSSSFVWLVRQPGIDVMRCLDELKLAGLHRIDEPKRSYPLGKIGAQVIGYTNVDGVGIEGSELYINSDLEGWDGKMQVFRDAKGRLSPSLGDPQIEPQDGCDVVMTIDWHIQEIVDEEIEAAFERHEAHWAGAIVMNPETGEILAMSNAPGFNPNKPSAYDAAVRRNRLVTDMMEPGSTFKIVTFAEALESGAIDESTEINCENGQFRIGRHTINDSHKLGVVPASDVFIHSSNIGLVKIAERIGAKRLYQRARLMGFGMVTGVDFPNESPGDLPNPKGWSKLSLPTISFGQGVAASPLQVCAAYAAVANGGYLVRPYIIREVIAKDGRPGRLVGSQTLRQVFDKLTAARIERLLCRVVDEGTGMNAAVPNIRVAGKTGTAQRIEEGSKGYVPGAYVSSFVGYVVDRRPKMVCLVIIDTPKGAYYGSQVAAPVFRNIVNRMMNMGNGPWVDILVSSVGGRKSPVITVPDLRGKDARDAVRTLESLGVTVSLVGDSTTVARQLPEPGATVTHRGLVTLYSNTMLAEQGNRIRVPDCAGKTVRQAIQDLVQAQLTVNVTGSGVVTRQVPAAGAIVEQGTECTLVCAKR